MLSLITKVMEVVVLPLFILTIGIEVADLANSGVLEIISFFNVEWVTGDEFFVQAKSVLLYFVLLAMISFILSNGLDKVYKYADKYR